MDFPKKVSMRIFLHCIVYESESFQLLGHIWLFATPQKPVLAPLSMVFSRQEDWTGLPYLSPEQREETGNNLNVLINGWVNFDRARWWNIHATFENNKPPVYE